MSKKISTAVQAAFQKVWDLTRKKIHHEEKVITPLQEVVSYQESIVKKAIEDLKDFVYAKHLATTGRTYTRRIIRDGKVITSTYGPDDLHIIEDFIFDCREIVDKETEFLDEVKVDLEKANRQLAAIKGQITRAQNELNSLNG